MTDSVAEELEEVPEGCVIMGFMSDDTHRRLVVAARNYERALARLETARAELADAIVSERKDGALIEDITAAVPYRQTQVNRILEAAGLTRKRAS